MKNARSVKIRKKKGNKKHDMTDPYKILGVSPNASDDEVKKAYRELCRKYHPDKNPGNQAAEDMFKIVQEAYEAVMNQRKNGGAGSGGYGSYGGGAGSGYGSGGYAGSGYGNYSYNSYGGSSQQGTQYSGPEATYYQAAVNYINSGSFREAINVLSQIKDRSAQWYYLSAIANSGLGNNYVAQEQARTAASMEPGNMYYSALVNNLAGGGYNYRNMQQPYGSNMFNNRDFCTQLCLMNMCFNACCDGDCCCCC